MSVGLTVAEAMTYAGSAAAALLYWKLRRAGLLTRHVFVGVFLLFIALECITLLVLHDGTTWYAAVWFAFEAARSGVLVLLILEMLNTALAHYRGVARLGRWMFGGALAIASLIAVLFAAMGPAAPGGTFPWLDLMMLLFRTVALWVFVFFVALLVILFWFSIELSRNTLNYIVAFSGYLASRVLVLLSANLLGVEHVRMVDVISSTVLLTCLGYLWYTISPAGEEVELRAGGRWRSADHVQLIRQLEGINEVLLQVGRK